MYRPGASSLGPLQRLVWLLLATGWLAGCALLEPSANQRTVTFSRIIDLSHAITQDMPHRPGDQRTRLIRADIPLTSTAGAPLRNQANPIQALQISLHNGTHMRLPVATGTYQPTVDTLSPRDLIAPAVVLDLRDAAQDNPDYALTPHEVRAWEEQHGTIPADSLVLLATGWDIRWGSPAEYLNLDEQQRPQVPGVGPAALALLQARAVGGIGIDTPEPLRPATRSNQRAPYRATNHGLLLANLTNLEQLPPTGATLTIGVLKIQGGLDSPVHVLALVP